MTEVDVFDAGGTMKTADIPDVSSKPDVTSNVDSPRPGKTRLEGKRQHSTRPSDQPVTAKPVPAKNDDMQEYRDDHDINDDAPVQVRKTPHEPGGDGGQGKIKDQLDKFDVIVPKNKTVKVMVIGKPPHAPGSGGVQDQARGASHGQQDTCQMLKDVPEASEEQQKIQESVLLEEEDNSKLTKKSAAKSAAHPPVSLDVFSKPDVTSGEHDPDVGQDKGDARHKSQTDHGDQGDGDGVDVPATTPPTDSLPKMLPNWQVTKFNVCRNH
jgi:hypothetical protein